MLYEVIQVLPSELGRSVTKSISIWDQGRCETGSGTSLPREVTERLQHGTD